MLGIVGIFLCFVIVPSILAVVFGGIAVSRANQNPAVGGRGRAIAGLLLGVISLAFFAGAFNIEIFRSGIEAVQRSTVEAADSLGMSRYQIYRHVVLPLAVRVCLPSLNNNLVNLIKTTTQAYAIAVPETLFVASQIWSDRINVFEMMVTLLTFYLIIVGIFVWAMTRVERAIAVPGFGR